jgi:hypothetical protein
MPILLKAMLTPSCAQQVYIAIGSHAALLNSDAAIGRHPNRNSKMGKIIAIRLAAAAVLAICGIVVLGISAHVETSVSTTLSPNSVRSDHIYSA